MPSKSRRSLGLLVSLIFMTAAVGRAQTPSCSARVDSASTRLDSAIVAAMREFSVPGSAVAVVREGKVQHLAGYGCANRAVGTMVDARRTVFHVASVSKPFVALAALQLATHGIVDLGTDVNRYLHDMQVPAGWNRPITLRDLLTHTAGLEESIVGYAARTPADIKPLGAFLATHLPRRGWAPGDVTAYSNYGYALAGHVVESAAGKPFSDYVRSDIFAPVGMTRSSFAQPMPRELAADAALSYRCTSTDCEPIAPDFRSAYPPGGLVTTAADMSRFMLAELGVPIDGKQVLSDSVRRLMHERQFTHDLALPGLTYGFAEDELAGQPALSHAGGAMGFTSFVILVPARQFGAFVVANGGSSGFGTAAATAIAAALLPPAAVTSSVGRLTSATATVDPTGAYRLTRYAHHGVENLPALFTGQLHIGRLGGDTVQVIGLGDANGNYVPVASNRWQRVNGSELLAVRTQGNAMTHLFGSQSFFGTHFPAAFERLAWYDEPHFVNEALSYVVAIPLVALLAWPIVAGIVWMVRRRTRWVTRVRAPVAATWRALAVVASVAFSAVAVCFAFGFIAATNRAAERGAGEIFYGMQPAMRALAYAPSVLGVVAAILVVAMLTGWRRRWWSVPGLLIFSLVTVNAVLFVALLARWGYFPVATG
jgi:CubicO group peptidase (beta-lactamase class C family)